MDEGEARSDITIESIKLKIQGKKILIDIGSLDGIKISNIK